MGSRTLNADTQKPSTGRRFWRKGSASRRAAQRGPRPRSTPGASGAVHSCRVQSKLFENGFGMVILTRKTGRSTLAVAGFLLDVLCLGVKDVLFREAHEAEIETLLDDTQGGAPLEAVDPSYARKLLHEAVAYARSLGLEPHADYAAAEQLFGDIPADAGDVNSNSVAMENRFTFPAERIADGDQAADPSPEPAARLGRL